MLADVRSVFHAGEARISWPELAARLREQMPGHYAEITADAISAQVRAFGVPSKSVKDRKHFDKGVGQGFDRAALDAAITGARSRSGDPMGSARPATGSAHATRLRYRPKLA